jgi:hypothetical protein
MPARSWRLLDWQQRMGVAVNMKANRRTCCIKLVARPPPARADKKVHDLVPALGRALGYLPLQAAGSACYGDMLRSPQLTRDTTLEPVEACAC